MAEKNRNMKNNLCFFKKPIRMTSDQALEKILASHTEEADREELKTASPLSTFSFLTVYSQAAATKTARPITANTQEHGPKPNLKVVRSR